MSLGWRFELHVSALGAFSLLMGVAVVRGLKMLGVEHAKLKWPNDVLVDNKKLAGILVETATLKAGGLGVVAGIGLNVCMPAMERERINQVITDMYEVLPEPASAPVTRNQLAAVILGECMRVCEQFPQNTADLLEEYRSEYDVLRQQVVVIEHDNGEQQTAIAVGVEDSGALRVRVYDSHHGHEQLLNAGDVSLRRVS